MSLIYAIGDIHGRYDLLVKAEEAIRDHASQEPFTIISVGDLVDRGPQSKEVVEHFMNPPDLTPRFVLRGNHEDMMIEAFRKRDDESLGNFFANGGVKTFESFGGDFPEEVIQWMESLPTHLEHAGRLFVHAGFMPGWDLHEQPDEWKMWLRQPFLEANPKVSFPDWPHIVHGHTWTNVPGKLDDEPENLNWRTNLDTGAFYTNVLTIGVFRGDQGGPPSEMIQVSIYDKQYQVWEVSL